MMFSILLAVALSNAEVSPVDLLLPRPKVVEVLSGVASHEQTVRVVSQEIPGVPELTADEAYELVVMPQEIVIRAKTAKGERAARATLNQLNALSRGAIPCCRVTDWPTFPWRGLSHDCGRNFLAKEEIFKLLDLMAKYKMNLFHWHLTDYYGWRLESKRYPMLQAPWAFRRQMGRYYSQDDFREVVAYAKTLGITVMPELDVPGHTLAFRRGLGIEHMAEKRVKGIVSDLFDELCSLVPAEDMPYVHMGTDEARTPYEMVPDSFCPAWAETIRRNGRVPVAWTPGKPIALEDGTKPVRMVWTTKYRAASDEPVFDTVGGYFTCRDPMTFINAVLFSQPMKYDIPMTNRLGTVICSWHDDYLGEDTSRAWTNCAFASAIVMYSDRQWSGRGKDRPEYQVRMPSPGTADYEEAAAFEIAVAAHRDRIIYPLGLPFAYVRQTPLRFRLTDEDGRVVAKNIAQATILIADTGRHGLIPERSYLDKPKGVAYVETWIKSPKDQTVGAWIGFNGYGPCGKRSHGLPPAGEWGRTAGTKVEVNGVEVPAPDWKNPGLKFAMVHPEEPTSDNISETALTNEEYYMREPTLIELNVGWNHVKLTVPKGVADEWAYDWVSTFIPVTPGSHPREVEGLEYSSEPQTRQ